MELGYDPSASTVTIAAILGVYNVMERTVGTGLEVLRTITANMRGVGIPGYYHLGTRSQIVLVLCPEHANAIAGSGLSKPDVREYIYANARMPVHQLKDQAHYGNRVWPNWIDHTNPNPLPHLRFARRHSRSSSRRRRPPLSLDVGLGYADLYGRGHPPRLVWSASI